MINLLPPQKLSNIRIARSNTTTRRYIELLLGALVVVIVALIAAYYYMGQQRQNVQAVIDADNTRIAALKPVQDEAERLSDTVNVIASISARDIQFSDMLVQIGGLMPDGAVLTGLQFSVEDFSSPLTIIAQVDTEAKAAVLLNNIQSSKLFDTSEIKTITKIEQKNESSPPAPAATGAESTITAPVIQEPTSPYNYNVVIDAYFSKDTAGGVR